LEPQVINYKDKEVFILAKSTNIEVVENDSVIESESVEIKNLIYIIRDKQVMIDSDLAGLYQVETKNLNRAMKRNLNRFPENFCFQLTNEEYEHLKCQNGTSSVDGNGYGGRRYVPYVYTEEGIAMLSAVLRSGTAIQVSIRIMQTFVEMRRYLANNALLLEKVNSIEIRQIESDIHHKTFEEQTNEKFEQVFNYIESHKEDNQKIFFEGQIFDAFSLMTELIQQANNSIVLIDGYVDVGTLNIMMKKKNGVNVAIYTLPSAKITSQDIKNFNAQYPNLEVKRTTAFHDRFLILDGTIGYHIGASIKDAGKKCFGINRIEDIGVIDELILRAQ
jgi:hypothetical protein